jgi:hypothetical protein
MCPPGTNGAHTQVRPYAIWMGDARLRFLAHGSVEGTILASTLRG